MISPTPEVTRAERKNMNNNTFSVYANRENMIEFLKSTRKHTQTIIEHYEFVLNDISNEISNKELEQTKHPTIEFLTKMIAEWKASLITIEEQLHRYGIK